MGQGWQNPKWQKSSQLCNPQFKGFLHTFVQRCTFGWSEQQHSIVHWCWRHDFVFLQVLKHLAIISRILERNGFRPVYSPTLLPLSAFFTLALLRDDLFAFLTFALVTPLIAIVLTTTEKFSALFLTQNNFWQTTRTRITLRSRIH